MTGCVPSLFVCGGTVVRTKLRPDAGCPAEGEGQPKDIGPKGRAALVARIQTRLLIQKRNAEDAEKMQTKDDHHDARHPREEHLILQEEGPEDRGREPQNQEHRTKPHNKEQGRDDSLAARGGDR